MGRTIKRLSGLEIDEVSLVNRPANQHGVVAIAKSQESVMGIFDAEGSEVDESDLLHGDYVYDDDGNEFVFLEDEGEEPEGVYEEEYATVGKAAASDLPRIGQAKNAWNQGVKSVKRRGAAARQSGQQFQLGRRQGADLRGKLQAEQVKNSHRGGTGSNFYGRVLGGYDPAKIGTAGAAVAGAGGTGYLQGRRGTKSASLGDEVMESLSKSLTDDDRSEVIAKAMDYVQDVAERNAQLEDVVKSIMEDRDVEGYTELAKSYELPVDPDEIAGIMYRASQTLPEGDVATLDRLFSSMGEISKSYYDEVGYAGGYEGGALGEVYAAAGEVVAKSGAGLTQEQAVTALFDANPAAYDEYEAEQRFNR